MGAALGRGDQVDVALQQRFATFRQPLNRPVHAMLVIIEVANERLLGEHLVAIGGFGQVVAQAIGVRPLGFGAVRLHQRDRQPRTQHRLGPQQVLQS